MKRLKRDIRLDVDPVLDTSIFSLDSLRKTALRINEERLQWWEVSAAYYKYGTYYFPPIGKFFGGDEAYIHGILGIFEETHRKTRRRIISNSQALLFQWAVPA